MITTNILKVKKVKKKLAKNEERLRQMADCMPQIVWATYPDGHFYYYNQRFYDYTGLNVDDAKSWGLELVLHPEDLDRIKHKWLTSLSSEEQFAGEFRIKRKSDGQYRWHLSRAFPIRNVDRKITAWFGTSTDIHEQKIMQENLANACHRAEVSKTKVESAREQLKTVLDATPIFITRINASEEIIFQNKTELECFQKPSAELINKPLSELFGDTVYLPLASYVKAALGGETIQFEWSCPDSRNNRLHHFLATFTPEFTPDNKVQGFVSTLVNITSLKDSQAKLEKALLAAESSNMAKSAFVANMSHEIRTPLSAILGFANLLEDECLPKSDREKFLYTIEKNGKALTQIIDDILDLANVETGKLVIEKIEFSLLALLNEVQEFFKDQADAKGLYLNLRVNPTVPQTIISDSARLRQILINIIGNALKFTNQGGIAITVDASLQKGNLFRFEISVQDSGIGVSPNQAAHIFEPFVQADNSSTRKYGGTGLGLSLSNNLAKALGGQIVLEEGGQKDGCTFKIFFLANVPKKIQQLQPVIESSFGESGEVKSLSGVKILLADDCIDNQNLICLLLEKYGPTIELASNGIEAVSKAMKMNYDFILMDIHMPRMDGHEATRSLRSFGYTMPIVACTAHAMPEERAKTRASGCDGHLNKPLNEIELVDTIKHHTRAHFAI